MSSLEKRFWYPGRDSRPWQEQFPRPSRLLPSLHIEQELEQDDPKPIIYDQSGRPIEQTESSEAFEPDQPQ